MINVKKIKIQRNILSFSEEMDNWTGLDMVLLWVKSIDNLNLLVLNYRLKCLQMMKRGSQIKVLKWKSFWLIFIATVIENFVQHHA